MRLPFHLIALYAAPVLLQLARLAPLPTLADRALGAGIVASQVAALWTAARRMARGMAADLVEELLVALTVFLVVPTTLVTWLGAAGVARPLPVLIAVAAACAALHLAAREDGTGRPPPREPEEAPSPLGRLDVALIALSVLAAGRASIDMLREAPRDADSVWYHLPVAAEIVRTGSILPTPAINVDYPGGREALVAWLAMPLRSDNLALLFPIEIAAAALALFSVARGFGLDRAASLAAVAVYTASPIAARAAAEQKNDLFLGVAFLITWHFLREVARDGLPHHAVMAGLGAGLMVATKFSGPPLLAVLLAAWLAADVVIPRRLGRLRALGPVVAGAVLVGAAWYGKNLVLYKNPLWPKAITLFGRTVFPGLASYEAQYARTILGLDPLRWLHHGSQFIAGLGPVIMLAMALPLAAPLAAVFEGKRFRGGGWIWLGLVPLGLAIVYGRMPYSIHPKGNAYWYVQPRFFFPFLGVASVGLAALVPARGAYRAPALLTLLAVAAGALATWMPGRSVPVAFLLVGAAPWIPRPSLRLPALRPWAAGALLLPAALLALGVEGYRERAKEDPDRGYGADPVEGWGEACLWVRRHVAHARIVYSGSIQAYPLFGPGLTNTLLRAPIEPIEHSPEAAEKLYEHARAQRADYIVAFSPVTLRYGPLGDRFRYGPPPTVALREKHPGAAELVFRAGHAEVVRLRPE